MSGPPSGCPVWGRLVQSGGGRALFSSGVLVPPSAGAARVKDRSPQDGSFPQSRRPVLWLTCGTGLAVGPVPAGEGPPPGPGDCWRSRPATLPVPDPRTVGRAPDDGAPLRPFRMVKPFCDLEKVAGGPEAEKLPVAAGATGGRGVQWKAPISVTSTMMAMRPHTTGPPRVPRPAAASSRSSAASSAASASCTTSFSAAASL